MNNWKLVIDRHATDRKQIATQDEARSNPEKARGFLNSLLNNDSMLQNYVNRAVLKRERIIILPEFFVFKYPKNDEHDEIYQQVAIGLEVNKLLPVCPNFVRTYGLFNLPMLKSRAKRTHPCCIVEKLNGISLDRFHRNRDFENMFPIFLQIFFAMAYAHREIGLTHYDLHAGNVNIIRLKDDIDITYPWGTVRTHYLAKIFDWGRSYCRSSPSDTSGDQLPLGRRIERLGIENHSNYFHDMFLVIDDCQDLSHDKEYRKFMDFFKLDFKLESHINMCNVAKSDYSWKKWLRLVLNCKYAENCFIANIISELEPGKMTYNDFIESLEYNMCRKLIVERIEIENHHVEKLKEAINFLTQRVSITQALNWIDLGAVQLSKEEDLLHLYLKIAEKSKSYELLPYYENMIEHYRSRLDKLLRMRSLAK
jgi:hypothetical protein